MVEHLQARDVIFAIIDALKFESLCSVNFVFFGSFQLGLLVLEFIDRVFKLVLLDFCFEFTFTELVGNFDFDEVVFNDGSIVGVELDFADQIVDVRGVVGLEGVFDDAEAVVKFLADGEPVVPDVDAGA
eukprot:CAMPEP_0116950702 /NCGR_PEP_ID=MMETSP0467-20121206/39630_1 /TAXON_ID=283647 /ORGANISM="Mesodinium pulex, Strain SPMC105" /LENGTH=128 /DNA_ID=CAMNT_0004635505 /DNA_START=572 /DNA_END=958 /DNA_ORIENTATION=-